MTDNPVRSPWMTALEACAYVRCKNVRAWYKWRKRHGIVKVRGKRGLVARADLDRVMLARPKPDRMAAASLKNLELRPHRKAGAA